MTKYIIVGDIHLADRAPSARISTYRDDIMNKLRWTVDYSNTQDIDALVLLGDVFHIKRPDRNSHSLVTETAAVLGNSKAPVVVIPGNHDVQYDDMNTIPSQPLGTLALHPNIELLIGPHSELPLYSVPYFDPTAENYRYWVDRYHSDGGPDRYPFIGTHQAIFPEKEEPIYDFISAESWAESFQSSWVAYGHIHSRMKAGAFYSAGVSLFCNNGAISRGSLHEETIHRELAITSFDSDKDTPFTSIPIPYRPASEVFNLEVVEVLKNRQTTVDTFLESLGSSDLQYLTIEGILDNARQTSTLPKEAVVELEDIIQNITLAD